MLFKMRNWVWLGMILAMVMLYTSLAVAQLPTEVDEASVSLTVNQLPGAPLGLGGGGALPFGNEQVSGFAATAFQSNGTVIRGRYHAEVGGEMSLFRVILYTDGTFKGASVSELGRQADLGVSFEVQGVGGEVFDVSGGIFGRSGGAFAKPNAFDTLAAQGYDENALEGYADADGGGLASLNPAPAGLSFGDRNSVNLLIQADVNLPNGIGGSLRFMPELAGSGEDSEAVDQLIANLNTSYELGTHVNLQIGVDIGAQRFRESGDVEKEASVLAAVSLTF